MGRTPVAAALLLIATFALKATVLAQLNDHPLLQPLGELDATYYIDLARKIATGGPLAVGEPFFVSPLYVYFLAAVFALGGSIVAAKVIQIVLGTAAIGLLYLTARDWFGPTAAWMAATLAALTGLFTFYEVLILQAALDPFLVALSLYLVTRTQATTARLPLVAAGVALGLLALNRPNALAYGAAVVALVAGDSWRRTARVATSLGRATLIAGGIALALAPNALRNYTASGELVWISSQGGLNFYIGNHARADGTYTPVPGISASIAGQARDAQRVAEAGQGRRLSTGEVSAYFYRRAWEWIVSRPLDAAWLFGWKILILVNRIDVPLNYSYAYYAREEPTLLRMLPVGAWLLMPLGIVGMFLSSTRLVTQGFWVWASFIPMYGLSVAIFFVSSRYRMPLLLPLCATSAATIVFAVERWREHQVARLAAPAVAMALVATLSTWNVGLDDGVGGERTRRVVWLIERGAYDEARRELARIAPAHPTPGVLRLRVGRAYATAGRLDDAIEHFRAALEIDRGQPAIHLELGQALVTANHGGEAIPHLAAAFDAGFRPDLSAPWLVRALVASGETDRAVKLLASLSDEVGASRAETAADLGSLALELNAPDQAERWLRMAVRLAPNAADAHEQLGVALILQQRTADAIPYLEEARRLDASSGSARLNLAVAYAQAGRLDEARVAAEEALRLDPNELKSKELLKRLTKDSQTRRH